MLKVSKYCTILFVLLILVLCFYSVTLENFGGDWLPFKDEKCFKVIDDTLTTYDEAEKACEKLENKSTLAIVHSKDEQDVLVNYLFKTLKKIENFWIGAKYSGNAFHWIDNSSFTFSDWDSKAPHNKSNYCVQVLAEEVTLGKWVDGPCEKKNAVVCQKTQTWTLVRLQEAFLEARKELNEANKKIADFEKNYQESLNPIPIGFIYTQLPNEKTPSSIWPSMKWSDVTSSYAGIFFRAEGGGSEVFGQIQTENDHRVLRMETDFAYESSLHDNITLDDIKLVKAQEQVVGFGLEIRQKKKITTLYCVWSQLLVKSDLEIWQFESGRELDKKFM